MLRTHGYRVFAVGDGPAALAVLQQEPVDMALFDVVMPGQSGFAVCRAAKDRPETRLTPVVLITGLGRVEDRIKGIEAGADDFLNKPVRKEELLARVKSLVRVKRFTDELESAETVVFTLAAGIEAKDPYTEGHCDRLSRYCVALGERLGLPEEDRIALRRGGAHSRYRQSRRPRTCFAEAGAARRGRAPVDGGPPRDWRAHLRPA